MHGLLSLCFHLSRPSKIHLQHPKVCILEWSGCLTRVSVHLSQIEHFINCPYLQPALRLSYSKVLPVPRVNLRKMQGQSSDDTEKEIISVEHDKEYILSNAQELLQIILKR
jgi:hypothetical protein